jgi:mRNA interferase HigB
MTGRWETIDNQISQNGKLYIDYFQKGIYSMHVISRKCLIEFGSCHPNVKRELATWFHMMEKKEYPSPIAIKEVFGSADIIPGDRVVFNIKGNSYRIIAKVRYSTQTMFIGFIGTHAEYSNVNAETI